MLNQLQPATLAAMVPGTYHDGGGLYLIIRSKTSASWHYRYQLGRTPRKLGLGSFPEVSLKRARELHKHYATMRAEGVDPVEARVSALPVVKKTIAELMAEFFEVKKKSLKNDGDAGMWWSPVNNHVLPKLGPLTLDALTIDVIVDNFRTPWETVYPTATKAYARFSQSIKFAADEHFDLSILTKARARLGTPKHEVKHHTAAPWKQAPELFQTLGGGRANPIVTSAFAFYLLTIPRVVNVTEATWSEFDLEGAVWNLSRDRMKSDAPFRVPLSAQAVAILRKAYRKSTGTDEFVFPSSASKYGVISLNTFNKRLGDLSTAHGLRSTFGDWAVETGTADEKLADRCLAHQTMGKVTRAYLRGDRIDDRRVVMQAWADFLTDDDPEARAERDADIAEAKSSLAAQRRKATKSPEIPDRGDKADWFEKG